MKPLRYVLIIVLLSTVTVPAWAVTELQKSAISDALKLVDTFSGMEMEAQLAGVNKDVNKQQQLLHEMLSIKPNNASTLMQLYW